MANKPDENIKVFNIRLPKDIWKFLKMQSISKEVPMTDIILECVDKYKKKIENKLTIES